MSRDFEAINMATADGHFFVTDSMVLLIYLDDITSDQADKWKQAMNNKIQSLK